ncbi:MAG: aspartyl protease family protein [Bacteroides sp.]|jgi:hypothetical protein|nr:aspartyl protease family protein [Bacteroides sp.]
MEQDLSWSIAQTGLPLITIELTTDDGKKGNLCFLIDTGATINIIYKFVCKRFTKSFIELEGSGSMIGFEGKEHKTQYMGITFQLEGQEYSGVFSVIEEYKGMKHIENESGIQVHGVLGMPFLRANKWIVDLDRLVIKTK